MHPLYSSLLSRNASDSSPADSVTLPRGVLGRLLKYLSQLNSSSTVPLSSYEDLNNMASSSDAGPTEPSPTAQAPAVHPTITFLPMTHVDLSLCGPAPSAPPAAPGVYPSLPEEILTLHAIANVKRLELNSRLAYVAAHISDLDVRISEFSPRIQNLTDRRAP